MEEAVQEACARSMELHAIIAQTNESVKQLRSLREVLAWAYADIALEHQQGIVELLKIPLYAPAFALIRSQIETSLRGLWTARIADEKDLLSIVQGKRDPFGSFKKMSEQIDEAYRCQRTFRDMAESWQVFCGFNHSGVEQLERRFKDQQMGPDYPSELQVALVDTSVHLATSFSVFLLRGLGSRDHAAEIEAHHSRIFA